MKGVEPLIAAIFIIIISITGIAIVLESSQPSVSRLQEISLLEEAKKILTQIDNSVRTVGEEGEGSTRVLQLSVSDGNYMIDIDKDSVSFSMNSKSQVVGRGVTQVEGNVRIYGGLNQILMNVSYSTVNITGGGSFGRGFHSLIIRNDGYDAVNQKQIISISLVPPVIIPVAFMNQYNQDGNPYILKGGLPSGYASYLNKLGEGLTYDISEIQDSAQQTKLWNLTPVFAYRQSIDLAYGLCAATSLRTDNSVFCGNTLGIDANEWGYVNSTHNSTIPSDATITNVTFCWNGYFETLTNDNANDRSYVRVGENSTGSWIYTNVASCSGTACNFYTDATRCYDVTNIINTIQKAKYVRISLYHSEADDNNRDIFDDYNYVNITYSRPFYRVEIWHNSSQIADGNISFINATVNFTTNVSDVYSLQIYDWLNSQWSSTGCDSGNVLAGTPTRWWCNETLNAMNYNSSDRRIRIRIDSTPSSDIGLLKEDYVQYFVGYAQ